MWIDFACLRLSFLNETGSFVLATIRGCGSLQLGCGGCFLRSIRRGLFLQNWRTEQLQPNQSLRVRRMISTAMRLWMADKSVRVTPTASLDIRRKAWRRGAHE